MLANLDLKAVTSAIYGVLQIANLIFGDWVWSRITEQEIGVALAALLPFAVWIMPAHYHGQASK